MGESRPVLLRKGTGTSSASSLAADEPRKRLRILDDRTSQMLAIAFNKLPPPERLPAVVDELEDFPEGLPPEAVLALHAAASEQREAVEQLRQLEVPESELNQLDFPERYLWVLGARPLCAAKLACGALIVGPARELVEIRQACERVGVCCQMLRNSELVLKCISTSLAVGNLMNRGTPRSGARAVVLPDALLKLDELRGSNDVEEAAADGTKGPSLLDFVAEALVLEAATKSLDRRCQTKLRAEAEALRDRVRAAQGVCLQEAEVSCQKVCQAASKAQQGLAEHADVQREARLASRVRHICDEANLALRLVEGAKHELQFSQEWSSAKPNTKGADWLSGWAQFLEQLAQAFGRVRLPLEPPRPIVAEVAPAAAQPLLKDVTNAIPEGAVRGAKKMDVMGPAPAAPLQADCIREPVTQQAFARPERRKEAVQLDDDERVEDLLARFASQGAAGGKLGLSAQVPAEQMLPPANALKPRLQLQTRVPFLEFDGKENSRR